MKVKKTRTVIRGKTCDCGRPAVLVTSGRQCWCQACIDKQPVVHSLHYEVGSDGDRLDAQERHDRIYLEEYQVHLPKEAGT